MDVREAVQEARSFLEDLFQDEGITDVGLEEDVCDDESNERKVTMAFSKPWDMSADRNPLFEDAPPRSYKVVRIGDQDGVVKSLTDRILPAALCVSTCGTGSESRS